MPARSSMIMVMKASGLLLSYPPFDVSNNLGVVVGMGFFPLSYELEVERHASEQPVASVLRNEVAAIFGVAFVQDGDYVDR